jgi:hypothetical protein
MDRDLRLRNGRAREQAIVRPVLILRVLAPLVLLLSGTTLAACGKSSLSSTTVAVARSSTTAKPASPGAPKSTSPSGSVTLARARAYARAVNLTAADVPGFTPGERHERNSPAERRLEREMLRCTGVTGTSKGVLEESSKSFELKRGVINFSVGSEVSVQPSAAQAERIREAVASSHVRSCFSRYLEQLLESEKLPAGASAGPVTIQSGTPPAPGASGGFGWRVTASFDVHGVKLPFYFDILGFVDGPSEVTLMSSGVLRPFPAAAQQHLFTLLLSRAEANAL